MERIKLVGKSATAIAVMVLSGSAITDHSAGMSGTESFSNPYSGMYGSMGNVYSPYYRQFHPGMSSMPGPPPRSVMPGAGASGPEHIINPYSGMYGSMGNVYSSYYRRYPQPYTRGMSGMGQAMFMPPVTNTPGMSATGSTIPTDSPAQGARGMSGMSGMSGYFRITPYGQIFFYPQSITGMSGR
jgi:hypothetical protein